MVRTDDAAAPAAGVKRSRAVGVLAVTSALGSTALAAGGSAGALLGTSLAGTDAVAGLPIGLLVLGSAGSAIAISRATPAIGRHTSLAAGYAVGVLGAALVVLAAALASLPLL